MFQKGYLGFHKQATHRRHDDEHFFTLGSTDHDWGWPEHISDLNAFCHPSQAIRQLIGASQASKYVAKFHAFREMEKTRETKKREERESNTRQQGQHE